MDYGSTLRWLYAQEASGIKFGLENTTELLSRMGDPHLRFRSLHVAGSNGKGSVSAMSASVLQEAGYRTALYTSPHLVDFKERIRVDGECIGEKEMLRLAEEVRIIAESMLEEDRRLTFFELTTAMAFAHFADRGVEEAVVEVGMGGRLDATNVLRPDCTVITNISLEHTAHLGPTLTAIAGEKAGIIKSGVPAVTIEQSAEAMEVISSQAARMSAPLKVVGRDSGYEVLSSGLNGSDVLVEEIDAVLSVPLLGRYQGANCALACGGLVELMRCGVFIPDEAFIQGISKVRWPARLEVVRRSPRLIFDVTHTPDGARTVAEEVERLLGRKVILVLGVLADKDVDGIAAAFGGIAERAVATAPATGRAADAGTVMMALSAHCPAEVAEGVGNAIEIALAGASEDDTVLVTGSLYTAGEAMRWLDEQTGGRDI